MLELKRCLADKVGNEKAKLFHIVLKDLIKAGLGLMAQMGELNPDEFERVDSHQLLEIRNEFLKHNLDPVRSRYMETLSDFVIRLFDSDEYYYQRILEVIRELKARQFEEVEPDPRFWA